MPLQTEGTSLPLEYQQVIPDAVHVLNSSFSGIKDKYVLTLSVFDWSTPCYWIHVRGTGSSSDMTCWRNLNMANLYIDPDTGKVIDIEWYNYFYENLNYKAYLYQTLNTNEILLSLLEWRRASRRR